VDLLIHDSQYTPDEFAERHDWGHCSYQYPIELARACGVKHTLLFHHDPGHRDTQIDEMAATVRDRDIEFACEGSAFDI
jgi:ribonuclease BN (tRNA processing enzyme)